MTVTLRSARIDDCERVWRWNCAPDVRAVSRSTEPVPYADHVRWYLRRLGDPLWIVEAAGVPVGVVRVSAGVMSVALDTAARGRGIGKQAIRLACAMSTTPIDAEIAAANVASRAAFATCGFRPVDESAAFITYRWSP